MTDRDLCDHVAAKVRLEISDDMRLRHIRARIADHNGRKQFAYLYSAHHKSWRPFCRGGLCLYGFNAASNRTISRCMADAHRLLA